MGWCGKLPNYADIIRSNQLVDVQNALMSWLAKGQDHIGEQFIKSNEVSTIYYFFLESSISDHKRIHGLFISSHDSRGRTFPFMIFTHDHRVQPLAAIGFFERQLQDLGLNWSDFSNSISNTFVEDMKENLKSLDVTAMFDGDMDSWIELHPDVFKSNFKIESTNHVIYRKLLVR